MPTFSPSTPRAQHDFQGTPVSVPYIFAEGHTLTALEALQVNRWLATAVGNAWGAGVRRDLAKINAERTAAAKAKKYTGPVGDDGKPAPATSADLVFEPSVQADFDAKFSDFVLGTSNRGRSGTGSDSLLDQTIRQLATAKVKALIIKNGHKVRIMQTTKGSDGETSKFNELLEAYVEKHGEWLTAQAEAQIAALAAHEDDGDDLDLAAA